MKTVIITRKYWGTRKLLNVDGTKCCLGFCAKSFGVKPDRMLRLAMPSELDAKEAALLPSWLREDKSHSFEKIDMNEASRINDSDLYSWEKKEKLLKELFAKHQIRLIFRGKR
jgi:hypothetical protein